MTAEMPSKGRPPLPISHDTAFWLDGARAGILLAQRCGSCGTMRHPPAPMCGRCNSLEWNAFRLSGRGSLYSYVIHHKPPLPGFVSPYAVLLVELDEGIRMISNLVDASLDELRIGLPLEVVFRAVPGTDEILPHWRPLREVA